MENPVNKLKELFEDILKSNDGYEAGNKFKKYIDYIKTVYPFNYLLTSDELPQSGNNLIEDFSKYFNKSMPIEKAIIYSDIRNLRPIIRTLHNYLLEKSKEMGYISKETLIVEYELSANKIYLKSNQEKRLVFRGKNPDRFKIIRMLLPKKSKMSLVDIVDGLNKVQNDTNQNNQKASIKKINKRFKEIFETDFELIDRVMEGSKYLYFLNRKIFDFEYIKR